MRSCVVTQQELRSMLMDELNAADVPLPDSEDIDVVVDGGSWRPILKRSGVRVDEAQHAALFEIGRRLAKGYVLVS